MTAALVQPWVPPTLPTHEPRWLLRMQQALVVLDGLCVAFALSFALLVRFPDGPNDLSGTSYPFVVFLLAAGWMIALALTRTYECRFLEEGPEEFKRVVQATVRLALAVGVLCLVSGLPLSRGFVGLALPLGLGLLLLERFAVRTALRHKWEAGEWRHKAVVIGSRGRLEALVDELNRRSVHGLDVVAACAAEDGVEVGGVAALVRASEADSIIVTAFEGMTSGFLRELAYAVERSRVDLLVDPSLVDVSGSRVSIRPVSGLPLLELREVELSGASRAIKSLVDRFVALVGLLVLAPVLGLAALAIRRSGPVLEREVCVGRDGRTFAMLSLRTRPVQAPGRRRLSDRPRTRLGRFLATIKLDDAPKLVNVLRGHMALVGPRPLTPGRRRGDVADHRLLRVKPGLTGLAQISGRADSETAEARRLDQQYVDNWSPALDLLIIAKTFWLFVRGRHLT